MQIYFYIKSFLPERNTAVAVKGYFITHNLGFRLYNALEKVLIPRYYFAYIPFKLTTVGIKIGRYARRLNIKLFCNVKRAV